MIHTCGGEKKVFACNANKALALEICEDLHLDLGSSEVSRFADGEINMRIFETIRGSDVFIIQPTSPPVNENLMELLIMIDAMSRASAGRITAVLPYFGYARQDRKAHARDPISAKLVADILTKAGADRILTMDLHCDQLQGFFDIPVDHLRGWVLFVDYFKNKIVDLTDTVVVSPDLGSVARARGLADKLDLPLAIVDKRRRSPNECEVCNIIGDIEDKKVILLDDIIDTAGSITNAAQALADNGAREIHVCCTHALFSRDAVEKINASPITDVVILNTIAQLDEKQSDKIKTLSVAHLFANAISRIHENQPVSRLFE